MLHNSASSLLAGTPLSLETSNRLLDLLCFYGDREPNREDQSEQKEELEESEVQKL